MTTTADVIVVGLGAMGSAALHAAARGGATAIGIDRHAPPHVHGSTHGDTRITRLAVGEGAAYAPLVARSHEIWREMEAQTGRTLMKQCGCLVLGVHSAHGQHGSDDFVRATIAVAEQRGISYEVLTAADVHQRYPALAPSDEQAYFESDGGYLFPEGCIRAHLELATRHGATVRTNETVSDIRNDGDGVVVTTNAATYRAQSAILSVGPWINDFLGATALFSVRRQVLYWLEISDPATYQQHADVPVYLWEFGQRPDEQFYGFPAVDGPRGGMKVAAEQYVTLTTPDACDRNVSANEVASMRAVIGERIPGLGDAAVRAVTCLYTVTPDHGFVIDRHPSLANVVVASPCSGHGFKHSAAIGDVVAAMAAGAAPSVDISAFALSRFTR